MHGFQRFFGIAAFGLLLAVLLSAPAIARSNCSKPCQNPQRLPIYGTVVDAQNGQPIAGATVTLRDWGNNTMDSSRHLYDLGTLRGKIVTGSDGIFRFPIQWRGEYAVRASAPGYLGAVELQSSRTASDSPDPNSGAWFGGSQQGNLRLSRNSLHLFSMSVQALEAFGPPRINVWWGMRQYIAAGFSSDGKRIGLVTLDKDRLPGESGAPVVHCRAWTYQIDSGRLQMAELPTAMGDEMFCSAREALTWAGETYYIVRTSGDEGEVSVEAIRGAKMRAIPNAEGLPDSVRTQVKASTGALTDDTDDGRFSLEGTPQWGCTDIAITSTSSAQTMSTGCAASYLLDRSRDLLFMIVGGKGGEKENWFGSLEELNLTTGKQRVLQLPGFELKPMLLTLRPEPEGATQLAYTIEGASNFPGECDQPESDYYPWPMLLQVGDFRRHADGSMPHLFSVCFLTVPPNP